MNLYVAQDGDTLGPFSDKQVRDYLRSGMFSPDDLGCPEGEGEWRPLGGLLPSQLTRIPPPPLPSRPAPPVGEQMLFQQGGVSVTTSRFIVENQVYAVRNISSVRFFKEPPDRSGTVILILFGVIVFLAGFPPQNFFVVLVGIALIGLGTYLYSRQKPTYWVLLSTTGSEVRAVRSKNYPYINGIIRALNQAIASHA